MGITEDVRFTFTQDRWSTRRVYVVYKGVCGVQECVWCTRVCVVYKGMCGVQGHVWCTRVCVMYKGVCGVPGCVWCTREQWMCDSHSHSIGGALDNLLIPRSFTIISLIVVHTRDFES